MRVVLALALVALSGCVDPQLGLGMTIGARGVHVSPAVSAGLPGGGHITVTP